MPALAGSPDASRVPAPVRLACGDSRSARAGAESVRRDLRRANPGLTVEVVSAVSGGADPLDRAAAARRLVLDGRAEASVCAWPDLASVPETGLVLAAVPMRSDSIW